MFPSALRDKASCQEAHRWEQESVLHQWIISCGVVHWNVPSQAKILLLIAVVLDPIILICQTFH